MAEDGPNRSGLIHPDDLPNWVTGTVLCESKALGWKDILQRTYLYKGQDVEIPPMDAYMLVQYRRGETPMDRQFDGRWTRTHCGPGHFSLLSRLAFSHWNWTEGLVVSHLYLNDTLMKRVARDIRGTEVDQVVLHDVLQGTDPVVSHIADQLAGEAAEQGPAGPLYAEALSIQLAVHLLRNYASFVCRASSRMLGLSQSDLAHLEDFIEANLHEPFSLDDMAALFGMGVWTFNRHLRRSVGQPAHAYVQSRRIDRACRLLKDGRLPLKEIAAACGFADQAHMTRAFRSKLGVTPGQYRKDL